VRKGVLGRSILEPRDEEGSGQIRKGYGGSGSEEGKKGGEKEEQEGAEKRRGLGAVGGRRK
jgi:hypothetical protein